ncbi:MAG: class II fructose-bisphosphate aldolase [Dehalococcoidia bacterium]|jgi:fructose/tagatose bisphosphate aldolase
MLYQSVDQLQSDLSGVLEFRDGVTSKIVDAAKLRKEAIDSLIYTAAFADSETLRARARDTIRQSALLLGIRPASIQALYEAMGRGEVSGFTVPALNLRALAYDTAQAVFRTMRSLDIGPVLFEIARSEIGYTFMRPAEYAANIEAAAIKEGYQGPLFIQGDHFQVNAAKYKANPEEELQALGDLTKEAIQHDFLNIDVDSSTLVDLSRPTVKEQQRPNFEVAAQMIRLIRATQPQSVEVSVGVEIGEVGGKNSTPEELRAFMDSLHEVLAGSGLQGPSKISVQTGSSHGGVVLPDGSVAKVAIAFDTLKEMSSVARQEYGMAGAVQHGASTLPDELFHHFVEIGTAEIHLATSFQTQIYDSPLFPDPLRQEIYTYLKEKFASEWKEGQTEAQFIYSNRKRGLGPFKRQMWDLPDEVLSALRQQLEERFSFLFRQLNVGGTRAVLNRYIP